jgi:hypothetical protein
LRGKTNAAGLIGNLLPLSGKQAIHCAPSWRKIGLRATSKRLMAGASPSRTADKPTSDLGFRLSDAVDLCRATIQSYK